MQIPRKRLEHVGICPNCEQLVRTLRNGRIEWHLYESDVCEGWGKLVKRI